MYRNLIDDIDRRESQMDAEFLPPPRDLEEQPKKRGRRPANAFGLEKKQPEEWELRGCETIEDPEEKEKYKEELKKKQEQAEKRKRYQAEYYQRNKEKMAKQVSEARKKRNEKKKAAEQEKLTLQDLTAEMITEEESNSDALERLKKLREGFGACGTVPAITEEPVRDMEEEYAEQVVEEGHDGCTEEETAGTETEETEAEEAALEAGGGAEGSADGEEIVVVADEKKVDAVTMEMALHLTESQAESLQIFIEGHIFRDIREDEEIDNMDWLADMCEIWRELEKWNTKKSSN